MISDDDDLRKRARQPEGLAPSAGPGPLLGPCRVRACEAAVDDDTLVSMTGTIMIVTAAWRSCAGDAAAPRPPACPVGVSLSH